MGFFVPLLIRYYHLKHSNQEFVSNYLNCIGSFDYQFSEVFLVHTRDNSIVNLCYFDSDFYDYLMWSIDFAHVDIVIDSYLIGNLCFVNLEDWISGSYVQIDCLHLIIWAMMELLRYWILQKRIQKFASIPIFQGKTMYLFNSIEFAKYFTTLFSQFNCWLKAMSDFVTSLNHYLSNRISHTIQNFFVI